MSEEHPRPDPAEQVGQPAESPERQPERTGATGKPGQRVLMVTPYPPTRDGIAAYAVQTVRALRAQGHDVEVLSPGPSAAHHHLDLAGPRGGLALAKRVRRYDRVIVQFHPDFFYPHPSTPRDRLKESLALTVAFRRAREVEVVVHEIDVRHGRRRSLSGLAARRLWRSVDRVLVHTEQERDSFVAGFGVSPKKVALTEHGADFVRRTRHDRAGARRSLGIGPEQFTFLSIGFIQPHKGFDRAVRAFAGLGARDARLDIVGSVRVEDPHYVAYSTELADLVDQTAGAHLHAGFVSDELFDRWIVACDVVVLPYRSIWSSGVLERAALYGRPVIATAVGGLPEQAGTRDQVRLVADDAELRAAMWTACGASSGAVSATRPWPEGGSEDGADQRARIQQEIVARAAASRGSRVVGPAARSGARSGQSSAQSAATAASAALRQLPRLELPHPVSRRPLVGPVKRLVRRLTAWQVDPVVAQVNALRGATVHAVEAAAAHQPAQPARVLEDRPEGGCRSGGVAGSAPGDRQVSGGLRETDRG